LRNVEIGSDASLNFAASDALLNGLNISVGQLCRAIALANQVIKRFD